MVTITDLIIATLRSKKTPLTNEEIRKAVQRKRNYTSDSTIDSTLTSASKKGLINKTPAVGRGKAKYLYSVDKLPSAAKVILEGLKGKSLMDAAKVHTIVLSVLPNNKITNTYSSLANLVRTGKLKKSKNPMTDGNVVSIDSKYMYSL